MSPRVVAEQELQRILALVPWIVAHPGRPKAEIAARFGISEEQLEADLGLVLMIGVPPYTPADYVDVDDADGRVTIRLADYLRRPLRLTAAEGLALLAAGRALLAVPGSDPQGPLATALAKLERVLDLAAVGVSLGDPPFLAALRDAAERRDRVEIDYWSAGRDDVTTRRVDVSAVFFAAGEWYAAAWCHRAGADRIFRVDRVRGLRPTGETFDAVGAPGGREVYNPRPGDPRVTLRLAAEAAWVAESYPVEGVVEHPDGTIDVVLAVSETAWLERLLLRLGPAVEVLEPPGLRNAGPAAALRVLARYRGEPS